MSQTITTRKTPMLLRICLLLLPCGAIAQHPEKELRPLEFYNEEWFPLSTMESTVEKFTEVESELYHYSMIGGSPEIHTAISMIFDPVIKESMELLHDPVRRKKLPLVQQNWMNHVEALTTGGGNIDLVINDMFARPSIASGQLYWCKRKGPLSVAGQKILDQILALEKRLAFKTFMDKDKLISLPYESRKRNIYNAYTEENGRIPFSKVDMGNGIEAEIPDPVKQAASIRKYEKLTLAALQEEYGFRFRSWQAFLPVFRKAAEEAEALIQSCSYGETLAATDQQLIPYLADLQARIIETASSVKEVAVRIIRVAKQSYTLQEANKIALSALEPYINK